MEAGVDIGGTFTDVVVLAPGVAVFTKLLTTPADHSDAFLEGLHTTLELAGGRMSDLSRIAHGTTLATNTLLQRTGARVGLITTRGFRDVLEIRRLRVPVLFDLTWQKPPPLVARRWRLEADERVRADGVVERRLQFEALVPALEELVRRDGLEAIAISLLHSYANPEHERAIARHLAERFPSVAVTLSSELLPLPGEYERTSTAVVNAYLLPLVGAYLDRVRGRLRDAGCVAAVEVMQSDGTLTGITGAMQEPARIVESGPAAGVIAAQAECRRLGIANAIALDIGGTTAKAALIEGGAVGWTREYEVGGDLSRRSRLLSGGGYALALPALDIAEISAGGGSVVGVTRGGMIQVGPRSAGAWPGPACYGLGGDQPTVTDAHLVVGHLGDRQLLGGRLSISADLARQAFAQQVAAPLRCDVRSAASGALEVANATMLRALRAVSIERGRDPRALTLVAYGGASGLHAAALARALGCKRAIIPNGPGVFSARGLLEATIAREQVVSLRRGFAELDEAEIRAAAAGAEEQVREWMDRHGYQSAVLEVEREAHVRQAGQWTSLSVPLRTTSGFLGEAEERFRARHELTYAHGGGDLPLELVDIRVRARIIRAEGETIRLQPPATSQARPGAREIDFGREHGLVRTRVIGPSQREHGPLRGPLVIETYDTTIVVPPGSEWHRDGAGNDWLRL